nr:hypothetical protein [Odoribacter sp. OF09-27XD]
MAGRITHAGGTGVHCACAKAMMLFGRLPDRRLAVAECRVGWGCKHGSGCGGLGCGG